MRGGPSEAWPAPAKLNLMLRVLGRRDDGYHRLQTVFQLLDHCDRVSIDLRTDGRLRLGTALPGVPADQDLAVRAARLLQGHTACPLGADLRIEKRIPMGGGLGGGSSDAATVLVALNELWGTGLSIDALARLGLALGADVPVFVRGYSGWGEGVGELLTPIELPQRWFLVLMPGCEVSTSQVFADPELTRDSASITIEDFFSGEIGNDCLQVVRRRYRAVADALEWLGQWGAARLTGTGACVFADFDEEDRALAVLGRAPRGLAGFVARGTNRSPLLDRLAERQG